MLLASLQASSIVSVSLFTAGLLSYGQAIRPGYETSRTELHYMTKERSVDWLYIRIIKDSQLSAVILAIFLCWGCMHLRIRKICCYEC
jgi:hypothetical protein